MRFAAAPIVLVGALLAEAERPGDLSPRGSWVPFVPSADDDAQTRAAAAAAVNLGDVVIQQRPNVRSASRVRDVPVWPEAPAAASALEEGTAGARAVAAASPSLTAADASAAAGGPATAVIASAAQGGGLAKGGGGMAAEANAGAAAVAGQSENAGSAADDDLAAADADDERLLKAMVWLSEAADDAHAALMEKVGEVMSGIDWDYVKRVQNETSAFQTDAPLVHPGVRDAAPPLAEAFEAGAARGEAEGQRLRAEAAEAPQAAAVAAADASATQVAFSVPSSAAEVGPQRKGIPFFGRRRSPAPEESEGGAAEPDAGAAEKSEGRRWSFFGRRRSPAVEDGRPTPAVEDGGDGAAKSRPWGLFFGPSPTPAAAPAPEAAAEDKFEGWEDGGGAKVEQAAEAEAKKEAEQLGLTGKYTGDVSSRGMSQEEITRNCKVDPQAAAAEALEKLKRCTTSLQLLLRKTMSVRDKSEMANRRFTLIHDQIMALVNRLQAVDQLRDAFAADHQRVQGYLLGRAKSVQSKLDLLKSVR